ncbi:uncharacterized protein LOC144357719 [Saccoglossus kowalevskii]
MRTVNGKHVSNSLPWTDGDQINIKQKDSRHIKVEVANKFSLSWNGFGNLVTEIDPSLYGKVCGLLGDADGNPDNDLQLQMPDGTLRLIDDGEKSGDSWMIPGSNTVVLVSWRIQQYGASIFSMGKVVLRALTLFLFSELLTRAQTSGLERERGAPLSDTHANGRRLDSFFSGYFQRDDRDLAAICNNGDVCSFEAEIGGQTRQFVGSCRQRCNPDENHSEFQMNLIGSKSKMCDVVKGCNCKCCASAATKNTLEMLGYKCVASKDTDDCFCKYGGTCKETCLDNEKWQDKPELCSVNCKCCVPVKPPPHPMLPGDKGDPHYTTFDLFSYTHTGHNCTYILFKECVKYPSFIVATKYSSLSIKKLQ